MLQWLIVNTASHRAGRAVTGSKGTAPSKYPHLAPVFEQDVRAGSNVSFELTKSFKPVLREPLEEDLTAKEKTDVFKLAGAIAGRIRDGEDVAVTTKDCLLVHLLEPDEALVAVVY
eukprot:CAMPEP_0205894842 /NCGR_PEP_ID=MMETSP1083-20121108/24059_1 /ASSEMBLY_ACC=CAM_ASM_000430 /TAXON_ID=97485 /ORGANISM="Prymnesium parvum, Strain Texoma1" /LENGTH=115 /DNA_ID=CAMNT_0053259721 /DNA_START=846 /DNA_END=1194 /DNA_ORIENTATION=+